MSFDEELNELATEYGIPADRVAAVRDASVLKAERDQAKADADAARAEVAQFKATKAGETFTKLGIPGTPDTYNIPDGVDVTDETQVTTWATNLGLIKPATPAQPSADEVAHQRMDAITTGAPSPAPVNAGSKVDTLRKQIMRAGPDQLQPGSELYSRVIDTLQESGHTFAEVPHSTNFERIPDWGSTKPA